MKNGKIYVNESAEQLTVKVTGEISANTVFPAIVPQENQNKIHLVLDEAGYVNSSGIQGWIGWVNGMQRANPNLQFSVQMLPANFARLAHHIRDFLPSAVQVESFVAPYFCANCNSSFNVSYSQGANWKSSWTSVELVKVISKAKCSTCESQADIDTPPESYEKFQPIK